MTNTFIYSMGNGWNSYNSIPDEQKSPSILKGCIATDPIKFIPLELFDGTLQNVFGNYYNWRVGIAPHWNRTEGAFIYDLNVSMPEYGIQFEHFNYNPMTSHQLSHRKTVDNQFKFFNENKRWQLFVIDFQNQSYRRYSNAQLLQFEKYLEDHAFNLQNFVYLDVDQNFVQERYANTQIQLFKFSNDDPAGVEGKQFILSKCFYAKEKTFVDETIARLKSEYEANSIDNG